MALPKQLPSGFWATLALVRRVKDSRGSADPDHMTGDGDATTPSRGTGRALSVSRRLWAACAVVTLVAAMLAGSVFGAHSVAKAREATTRTVHRATTLPLVSAPVVHRTRNVTRLRTRRRRAATAPVVRHRRRRLPVLISRPLSVSLGDLAKASPVTGKAMFGVSDTLVPYLSSTAALRHLDAIASTGARWIRVDFSWAAIQSRAPTSFNWALRGFRWVTSPESVRTRA
jgi:hypothetical protein